MPVTADVYCRRARCTRVIDGDTLELDVDLGFYLTTRHRVRVLGVDCPEMFSGDDRDAGRAAKQYTEGWVDGIATSEWPLVIRTEKSDSFGRYLADVVDVETGSDLAGALLRDGHAVIYQP